MAHRRGPKNSSEGFPLLTGGKRPKTWDSGPLARIDTLGFVFDVAHRVDKTGATVNILDYGSATERERVRWKLAGGGFLSVSAGRAWVEASLPKRVDGENVEALPVADMWPVISDLYLEACERVRPVGEGRDVELCDVNRLDPVRDFEGVAHVGELLDGLAGVPRVALHKVRRWATAERNRSESLRVGPKSWAGQLYDKHVETCGVAEEGRVRFEARHHAEQLTSVWAKEKGFVVGKLCDIDEDKVSAMTRATFERVGFDREVVGKASVAEKVRSSGLSRQHQAGLWVFLTMPGASESMSKNTRGLYRRLASDLGVTMASAQDEMADVVVRLDFDSGREACRVA